LPKAGELLAKARGYFVSKGIESARLDAELLLAHTLGIDRLKLFTDLARPLKSAEVDAYRELIRRRGMREPIAYILGHREFLGWRFDVSPDVLIPRPETEHLVEAAAAYLTRLDPAGAAFAREHLGLETVASLGEATPALPVIGEIESLPAPEEQVPAPRVGQLPRGVLAAAAAAKAGRPWRVADIGTGSGIVGICLARLFPALRAVLSDVSPSALRLAHQNAQRNGVADRVVLLEGDLAEPLRAEVALHGPFDLITANLPYVDPAALPDLAPELRHEPLNALVAPERGLALIRRLIEAAPAMLAPRGLLALEIGYDQGDAVIAFLHEGQYRDASIVRDLAGHTRVALGHRPA